MSARFLDDEARRAFPRAIELLPMSARFLDDEARRAFARAIELLP